MKRLQHPGVPMGAPGPNLRTWQAWNRGFGLAMFTGLAALSGATSVIVLHRFPALPARPFETGSLNAGVIARADAVSLARSVMQRLDDANRSGNYEIFRSVSAPGFQSINSAADLAQIFGWLRKERVSLDAAAGLDEGSLRIEIETPSGLLRLMGQTSARPEPAGFDMMFQNIAGEWRLFGIAVFRN